MRFNIIRGKGYAQDWNPFLCENLVLEFTEEGLLAYASTIDTEYFREVKDGIAVFPIEGLVGDVTLKAYRDSGNEIPLGVVRVTRVGSSYMVAPMVDVVGKVCTTDAEVALLRKEVDSLRFECSFLAAQIKKMMEGYDVT